MSRVPTAKQYRHDGERVVRNFRGLRKPEPAPVQAPLKEVRDRPAVVN